MGKAAIYIRVSTLDQALDGYSLPAQQKALEAWANAHGYDVFRIYADRGISGKDIIHRPAMLEMLEDVKGGEITLVLVWALSRLTRSVSDLYSTWEKLQKCNVSLVSYTEPFDTSTPIGRAMMGLLGVFAQMEREITAERVKAAMLERATEGKRTCNEVLGYKPEGSDGFSIVESEADIVRFIFGAYLECENFSSVARQCAERGFHGKRGAVLKAEHIKKILTRPVYSGYNSFCGRTYKGNYAPIIDEPSFQCVQEVISAHEKKRKSGSSPAATGKENEK